MDVDPFFLSTTAAMEYKPGRMIGTIGYQNQAVDCLALSGAGIFLICRSVPTRLLFLCSMFTVAGLTGNRGGVLAFALAVVISQVFVVWRHESWSPRKMRWVGAVVTLGVLACLGAVALIPETGSRLRELMSDYRRSPAVGSRLVMARIGVDMFQDKPWIGWGAGEYAFRYLDRLAAILPDEKTHDVLGNLVFAREAHNDYLQFAVEFGFVGVALLGGLVAVGIFRLGQAMNAGVNTLAGIAFMVVYMAVASLFSFPWQTSMAGPLAGLLLGWLWPGRGEAEHKDAGPRSGALLTICTPASHAVVVSLSLVLAGWFGLDAFLNTAIPAVIAGGDPSAAERLLPRFAYRYHALVGAAYAAQGAYGEAESELLSAQKGYRDILLWNNLGHTQAKLGKWSAALEVYERWASCGLDHPNALANLSVAREHARRFREAVDTLVTKHALWGPPSPAEIKRLIVIRLQSGDPRAAQDTLRRHRRIWMSADSMTLAEIDNLEGAVWLALGDRQQAGKWFRTALEKNPVLESARRNLESLSGIATNTTAPARR